MHCKRLFALFGALLFLLQTAAFAAEELPVDPELGGASAGTVSAAATNLKVVPSPQKISVNGTSVKPQVYNINGNNYFKLRDVAFLLSGTTVTFDLEWNNPKNAIDIIPNKTYTAVGGEMTVAQTSGLKVQPSTAKVLLDGGVISVTGYNINNNNYYKVADLASEIGFTAAYDRATDGVLISTPKPPEPEPEPEPTPEPEPAPEPEPEPEPPKEPRVSQLDGEMTVILDAGHGGTDGGAKNEELGLDEKHVNLYVSQYLEEYLRDAGVQVIMVRDTLEEGSSLSLRGEVMEQYVDSADLFFSVHHNAATGQARGAQVLAQIADENGGPSQILADALNEEYAKLGLTVRPIWYRKGQNGDYYYTNRVAAELQIVAVTSEFCFIDNAEDVQFIDSEEDWQAEARGLCNAILSYFSQVEY